MRLVDCSSCADVSLSTPLVYKLLCEALGVADMLYLAFQPRVPQKGSIKRG